MDMLHALIAQYYDDRSINALVGLDIPTIYNILQQNTSVTNKNG
jgi:hypothetical protein